MEPSGDLPAGCDRRGASNVIAEHRPRVGVGLLDGCAGEPDERRIGQGQADKDAFSSLEDRSARAWPLTIHHGSLVVPFRAVK